MVRISKSDYQLYRLAHEYSGVIVDGGSGLWISMKVGYVRTKNLTRREKQRLKS